MYIYIYMYWGRTNLVSRVTLNRESQDRGGSFVDLGVLFKEETARSSGSCDGPSGSFEHSNRELLALYICRNIAVFVLLCVGFSLCYVQALVCVMCSLQPRTSSLRSEHAPLRSVGKGPARAEGNGPTRAQEQQIRPSIRSFRMRVMHMYAYIYIYAYTHVYIYIHIYR